MLTKVGGPVSWRSTLPSIVRFFSTEAEYMTATKAIKEETFLHGLINDFVSCIGSRGDPL